MAEVRTRIYVLASSSRQAWLWHRESGEVVYQATELEPCAAFSAIAFHPLGDWAAIGRRDGRIDLVAPEIGMPIQTLKSSFGPSLLVPHPDGTELTAGAHGINFLRLKSDNYTKRGRQSHLKLEALYLSEDAEQLVAQNAKFASIWDLASSQPPVVLEGGRSIASSDGSLVAVGPGNHQSRDPSVRIWQRETRQILAEVAHEVEVTSFALEPTGDLLATGAMDGGVRIWEAGTGRLLQQLQGPAEKVDAMVWIEAGQALVVGFHDGSLWVWDLGATEPRAVLPHPEGEPVWRLEALPTRGVVLAQIANGDAYLRNHSEQQLIGRIGRRTSVDAIAATNDGRFAVMDFAKRHPLVWSIENDQALFALEGRDALVQALAFDVHGEQFLTGGLDGALGLSSARNGRLKSLHRVSPVGISAIELHPEGRFLILGDQDGVLRFWSVAEQREIVRVLLHREWLWAVLAPDGRWDAWGGEKVALADLVAWSGLEPGYLSNHPENFAPGLLAEVLRPYQE
ncbi:MAG: WD40 repeat domain-containing protein [Acidobacteriota bacterium]